MIYGYMRKSNEEGSNSSFDTQKHKIQGYCQIHNLKVDEYFEDICSGGLLLEQRQSGMLMSTKLKKGDTIICSTFLSCKGQKFFDFAWQNLDSSHFAQ